MYNNNIRTDSEIHQFMNSEFRNDRLRLEWPLQTKTIFPKCGLSKFRNRLKGPYCTNGSNFGISKCRAIAERPSAHIHQGF